MADQASEGIYQQVGRIEMVEHVGDQGLAGAAGPGTGQDLAVGIAVTEIVDVVPGKIGAVGADDVPPELVEGGERVFALDDRTVGLGDGEGVEQGAPVEQFHPRPVGACDGIEDPLAQDVGGVIVGAIALALVDEWGRVVGVIGVCGN